MASQISDFRTLSRREGRDSEARACRCRFHVFSLHIELCSIARIKSKRGLKEAIRLLVTRGAGLEESQGFETRVSCRGCRCSQVDCTWCVCCPHCILPSCVAVCGVCVFAHDGLVSHRLGDIAYHLWNCLMNQTLGFLRGRRLEVERILS